ncbi:Hypothetical_protein [Hexamita inflata]|uniref:Hypothetical_protein n=1 Tax=Hexamita inflata TaxID=28002 RepID=A0AA86R423_9EUKA|nr:Hypothetical protein HINF_LOCUS53393 [Hexamita inflata]
MGNPSSHIGFFQVTLLRIVDLDVITIQILIFILLLYLYCFFSGFSELFLELFGDGAEYLSVDSLCHHVIARTKMQNRRALARTTYLKQTKQISESKPCKEGTQASKTCTCKAPSHQEQAHTPSERKKKIKASASLDRLKQESKAQILVSEHTISKFLEAELESEHSEEDTKENISETVS